MWRKHIYKQSQCLFTGRKAGELEGEQGDTGDAPLAAQCTSLCPRPAKSERTQADVIECRVEANDL